jgi:hypothetical protein
MLPYLLLLFLGAFLPSDGNHGLFSPKSLCFLLAIGSFLPFFFNRKSIGAYELLFFLFLSLACIFLSLFSLLALSHDFFWFGQFKLFVITLFTPLMGIFFYREGRLDFTTFLKTLVLGNTCYSLLKVAVLLAFLLGVGDVWGILEGIGVRYMSMTIVGGLSRLQTSVDLLSPFLLFFVLQSKGFSKIFKRLYIPLTLLSVFLSFSRFLMFVACVALLLHTLSLPFRKIFKVVMLGVFSLGLGLALIGEERAMTIFENRLQSRENSKSDDVRVEQVRALAQDAKETPLFGRGLGSFSKECVRDITLPYSYEVQWVAFFMQFGLIGLFFLASVLFLISYRLNFAPLILFGLFIASGFTNPYLISLTSGILYTLFFLAGEKWPNSSKFSHSIGRIFMNSVI